MPAHLGSVTHRRDDAVAHVSGVRAHKPDSLNTVDGIDRAQQISEIQGPFVNASVVGIDRLAKQYNFRNSRRDRGFSLANHFGKVSTALGPASGGHDAVCALVVAAALHRNPRLHTVEPAWRKVFVVLVEIELDSGRSHPGPRTVDQRRKLAISVWPDDQTQVLDPMQ